MGNGTHQSMTRPSPRLRGFSSLHIEHDRLAEPLFELDRGSPWQSVVEMRLAVPVLAYNGSVKHEAKGGGDGGGAARPIHRSDSWLTWLYRHSITIEGGEEAADDGLWQKQRL